MNDEKLQNFFIKNDLLMLWNNYTLRIPNKKTISALKIIKISDLVKS